MLNKRNRTMGVLATIAMLSLALTACFGSAEGADDGESGSGSQERVYVQALGADPQSFNAQLTNGASPTAFSAQMLDTLIRISDTYELSPGLAEEWELSEDGKLLTLTLREGVTWHDGEPFTAEDVKFNLDEIVELQTFGAALAARFESVDIVDDRTVEVHLSETYGPILETLAVQYMLPAHVYEGTDYVTNPANMAPIGTGPMIFKSFQSGSEVILEKNPDYWDGEVLVDRAVYPVMSDPNSRAIALFAGEVDQAGLDPAQLSQADGRTEISQMSGGAFPQVITMMFNGVGGKLDDPELRKLVYAALDRTEITDVALGGRGTPAQTFFPPDLSWAVNDDVDFATDFPHDVDAINDALDDAGYPIGSDGSRFTLNVRYITELSEVGSTAEMAAAQLEEVGITLNLVGSASAVFTEKVYTEGDFDVAFLRSTLGSDPSNGIVRWYACNPDKLAASNPSGICDDEIMAAASAALASTDREVRGEAFRDLQDRARELMIYAPVAWYTGWLPMLNDSRWQGLDEPMPATNLTPWTTMTLKD